MGIALKSVDDLQEHLLGVFQRSDHHAGEVNEVLLAIAGGILWRKNPGDHVRVNEKEGAGGNVIWFRIGIQRYALLYNHRARCIELMFGGRRGHLVQRFTNATPLAEVSKIFSTLGMSEEEAAAYATERAEVKAKFPNGHKGRHEPVAVLAAEAPVLTNATEAIAPVEPLVAAAADKPARRTRKPAVANAVKAVEAPPLAEVAEPAKKRAARQPRKPVEVVLPEAIQLPLVAIPEAVPKKTTTPRKRRTTTKPVPEVAELTVVVATDPPELAAAAAPKPRTRSRSKSAPAPVPALQPA